VPQSHRELYLSERPFSHGDNITGAARATVGNQSNAEIQGRKSHNRTMNMMNNLPSDYVNSPNNALST